MEKTAKIIISVASYRQLKMVMLINHIIMSISNREGCKQ